MKRILTLLTLISMVFLSTSIAKASTPSREYTEITLAGSDLVQTVSLTQPTSIKITTDLEEPTGLGVEETSTTQTEPPETTVQETTQTEPPTTEEWPYDYIDEVRLTFYCPCARCCGKSDGVTYTGTRAEEGRTIAVNKNQIPLGSHVLLVWPNGTYHEYIAEDIGVGWGTIDVFLDEHGRCNKRGIEYATAYIKRN